MPGFAPVTAQTSFSPEKGCGWVWRRAGFGFVRDLPTPPIRDADSPEFFFTPLIEDAVWGVGSARFQAAVPNGRYHVFWLSCCPVPLHNPPLFDFALTIEDQTQHVRLPQWYVVKEGQLQVQVKDGALDVQFDSTLGWLINALVICDEDNFAQAQAEWARHLQEVNIMPERMKAQWQQVEWKPPGDAPKAAPPDVSYWLTRVEPFTLEPVGSAVAPAKSLTVSDVCARGSKVWFGLSFHSRDYTGIVRVACQMSRVTRQEPRVTIFRVQRRARQVGERQWAMVPELLMPCSEFSIKAGDVQWLVVSVQVQPDAEDGTCTGKVRLLPKGAPSSSVTLELSVLPFRLPEDGQRRVIAYQPLLLTTAPLELSKEARAKLLRRCKAELLDIKRHGFTEVLLTLPMGVAPEKLEQVVAAVGQLAQEAGLSVLTQSEGDGIEESQSLLVLPEESVCHAPVAARFLQGIHAWRSGGAGTLTRHYQLPFGNPFCDFDSIGPDACLTYPDFEGALPTLQWEALQAGIEDAKLLTLLQQLVEQAQDSSPEPVRAKAREAKAFLDSLKGIAQTPRGTELARLRFSVLSLVRSLSEALSGQR